MPTYEYICECGYQESIMRHYSEPEKEYTCPDCGILLTRLWTAPGIHFKGGGWGGQG